MSINLILEDGKINKNKIRKEWIEKNLPDYFNNLLEFNKKLEFEVDKFSQLIYHYENNLICYPKCELCSEDNKRFVGYESGYKLGCSRHCAILLTRPKSNETRRLNTIEKYGVEHTTQLESVRDKMNKTNLEKYGFQHASKNDNIKSKIKETNNIKYGCDLPLQNEDIKSKMISNFENKWGFDNPIKSEIIKDKIKKNSLEKYGTEWHISSVIVKDKIKESQKSFNFEKIKNTYGNIKEITILSYDNNLIKMKCNDCNSEFEMNSNLLYTRYFKNKIKICSICNPINNKTTNGHNEIINFLKEIGIENITINNRKIISPYELDIYLPDYKLAIEYNGLYWHSELNKDKDYHVHKYEMCNNIGISLIQIWEDDWNLKNDILKSIIKNRLNKNEISIGSRKCEIKEVSEKETKSFLNENHIQGWCVSKYKYGLYYNGDLVSLATFSNGRKNLNGSPTSYELVRFCNLLNTNINGSMSRLLNHFVKTIKPSTLISYCDNDFFTGDIYRKMGMNLDSKSLNYWWSDGIKRYNRWNFRKDKLIKDGFGDISKTEKEIMFDRGWFRCYGSGNLKYIKNY